ncbi:MAG: DNA helicase [Muribaculaceae bacterium]|nr:DNA helicase [Muribaculaceae bacterium]
MKTESDNIMQGFPPPVHDYDCETMVLASLMTSYNNVADMEPVLDKECFYDLHNQEIYSAIKTVYKSGSTPSIVTVRAELAKIGSRITAQELTKIVLGTVIDTNPYPLAFRLKELNYRRKIWEIGVRLVEGGSSEIHDIETLQNEAKTSIDSLFEDLNNNCTTLTDAYREVQEQMLLNRDREPGQITGTPTGFSYFDNSGGLTGTDLIIIGADTSQGKTSFATLLAVQSIMHSHKVAFYSMEMTPKQLAARISSMFSGVNSKDVLNGRLELNDIYRIDAAMEKINTDGLFFDGRSTSSLESIIASIRQLKMKQDIKGAVVDYLQLIRVEDKKLNREQAVAKAARDLKNLAKELDIWIIALSQLSRRDKGSPVPSMAQLRDSGQIEEAADTVILLYRPKDNARFPAPFEDVSTTGTALIRIEKGRNIGVGEFICGFRPENTLFFPLNPTELKKLTNDSQDSSSIPILNRNGMPLEELPF